MSFPANLSGVEAPIFTPIILSWKGCDQFSAASRNPIPMSVLSNRSSPPPLITHLQTSLILDAFFSLFIFKLCSINQIIEASFGEVYNDWFFKKKNFSPQNSFFRSFSREEFGNIHNFEHFLLFEPRYEHFSILTPFFKQPDESH